MKHKPKITVLLLGMFLLTQFIGLCIVNYYYQRNDELPYGLQPPEIEKQSDYQGFFYAIVIAFILSVLILFLLTKFKLELILRLWFFAVVVIALGISIYILTAETGLEKSFFKIPIIATAIALPLAFFKIYKRNLLIHNITELFIYPAIACVFVPILNLFWIIVLLVLISIYDIWAVWHSGIMQKMAKFQIDKLNVLAGFFVPYLSKQVKAQIKKIKKQKTKSKRAKKIKVNIAILGGGDIIFPIIAAGVVLRTDSFSLFGILPSFIGGVWPALFVVLGAVLGLGYLFFFSEKKKFYPAMPFITAGIFIGLVLSYLIFSVF